MPIGDQRSAPPLPEQEAATQRRQAFSGSHKGKLRNASPIDQRSKYATSEESSAGFDGEEPDEINWFEDVYEVNDTTLAAEGITGWPLTYDPIPFSEIVMVNGLTLRRGQQFYTFEDVDDGGTFKIGTLNDAFHGYPQGQPWEIRIQYAFQGISSITPDSTPVSSGTNPPSWGTDPWDAGGSDPNLIEDWKRILIRFTTSVVDEGVIEGNIASSQVTYDARGGVQGGSYDTTVENYGGLVKVGAGLWYPAGYSDVLYALVTIDHYRYVTGTTGDNLSMRTVWRREHTYGIPDPLSGSIQLEEDTAVQDLPNYSWMDDWDDKRKVIGVGVRTKNTSTGRYTSILAGKAWHEWPFHNAVPGTVLAQGSFNAGDFQNVYQPVSFTLTVDEQIATVYNGGTLTYEDTPVHMLRLDIIGSGSAVITGGIGSAYRLVPVFVCWGGVSYGRGTPTNPSNESTTYYINPVFTFLQSTGLSAPDPVWELMQPVNSFGFQGIGFRFYSDPYDNDAYYRWGPWAFQLFASDMLGAGAVSKGPYAGSTADGSAWRNIRVDGVVIDKDAEIDIPNFYDPTDTLLTAITAVTLDKHGEYISTERIWEHSYALSGPATTVITSDSTNVSATVDGCMGLAVFGQSARSNDGTWGDLDYDQHTVCFNRDPAAWDFVQHSGTIKNGQFDAGDLAGFSYNVTYDLNVGATYATNGTLTFNWRNKQATPPGHPDPTTIGALDIMLITADGLEVSAGSFSPHDVAAFDQPTVQLQAKRTDDGFAWWVNPVGIGFRAEGNTDLDWGPYLFSPPIDISMAAGLLDADTESAGINATKDIDGLLYYRTLRPVQSIVSQTSGVTSMASSSTPFTGIMDTHEWELEFNWNGNGGGGDPQTSDFDVMQDGWAAQSVDEYPAPEAVYAYAKLKSNRATSVISLTGFSTSVTHLDGSISGDSSWVSGGSDPADPGDGGNVPDGSGDWDIDTSSGGGGASW